MAKWEDALQSVIEFIDNDEGAWNIANDYLRDCKDMGESPEWRDLRTLLMDAGYATTFDGMSLDDGDIPDINIEEHLEEMIDELD